MPKYFRGFLYFAGVVRSMLGLLAQSPQANITPASIDGIAITSGGGKRLFADGTMPAAFKVTESTVTSKGVIIVNYERAGAVPTGSL